MLRKKTFFLSRYFPSKKKNQRVFDVSFLLFFFSRIETNIARTHLLPYPYRVAKSNGADEPDNLAAKPFFLRIISSTTTPLSPFCTNPSLLPSFYFLRTMLANPLSFAPCTRSIFLDPLFPLPSSFFSTRSLSGIPEVCNDRQLRGDDVRRMNPRNVYTAIPAVEKSDPRVKRFPRLKRSLPDTDL